MTLKDSISSDVSSVFLNTDDFAESIEYFYRAGGSDVIAAIVDRNQLEFYEAGETVLASFSIDIANSSTNGVLANVIDTGGDEVELLAEAGDSEVKRLTVLRVLESDYDGMIKLALK